MSNAFQTDGINKLAYDIRVFSTDFLYHKKDTIPVAGFVASIYKNDKSLRLYILVLLSMSFYGSNKSQKIYTWSFISLIEFEIEAAVSYLRSVTPPLSWNDH